MPSRRQELAAAEQAAIAQRFRQRAQAAGVSQADHDRHDDPNAEGGLYDQMWEDDHREMEAAERERRAARNEATMNRDPRDFRAPSDLPTEALDADGPIMPPRQLPTAAQAPVKQPDPPAFVESDRPTYYEIEVDGDSVDVGLRTRDGQVKIINIPPMTMKRINMLGWYQERVNRLQQQLLHTQKEDHAQRVANDAKLAQERLVRYLIPEFPVGLFGDMSAVGFKRLMDIVQQLTQEALDLDNEGGSDPNV